MLKIKKNNSHHENVNITKNLNTSLRIYFTLGYN